ncbi:MAG: preprotein translocase subunit YajC [Bacteroidales bacterium]|nr:preprotein translocase subunit YajC [Bacteroidales bacterium]
MNILYIALQAQGAAAQGQVGGGAGFWIMIILMFVVMWFFMIRPQRKQQKELEAFRNALKKGDKVVTAGGIYGTVQEIQERTVLIKVDGEVKLRVDKNSIQKDYSDAAAAAPAQPAAKEEKPKAEKPAAKKAPKAKDGDYNQKEN